MTLLAVAPMGIAQENPWTRVADRPMGRIGLSTSAVNGLIYAIGGEGGFPG